MQGSRVFSPDEIAEALSAACLENLPKQLSQLGGGLFILIDPMLGDPVLADAVDAMTKPSALNELRSRAWSRPIHSLRLPQGVSLHNGQAPYLVELNGSNDPWLATSIEWAVHETVESWSTQAEHSAPHRIGGWLQSASFGARLAEHISAWLRLRTRTPTSARYLRLADRRVLSLTAHVIGPETLASHLSPVQHWHWLDAHAAWRTLSASSAEPKPEAAFDPFTPIQWDCMRRGEAAHQIIAHSAYKKSCECRDTPAVDWGAITPAQWQTALNASATPGSEHLKQPAP